MTAKQAFIKRIPWDIVLIFIRLVDHLRGYLLVFLLILF